MTESEVIKICNTIIFASSLSNPQGTALNTTKEELAQAMGMAIQALEKQIPKRPDIEDSNRGECCECQLCRGFIGYMADCENEHYQINYCPSCGQKLDWRE